MYTIEQFENQFHPISLEDREWILPLTKASAITIGDQTFGVNYVGSATWQLRVAEIHGCAVYRYEEKSFVCFSYPIGPDPGPAAEELLAYLGAVDADVFLSPVDFRGRQQLLAMGRDDLLIIPDRDYFDYLYRADDLRDLRGKRYAAKRNHIHRFTEKGDWSYEPLSPENAPECLATLQDWQAQKAVHDGGDDTLMEEYAMEDLEIHKSLRHLTELDFWGGVLRRNGRVIAFSICEEMDPATMVVHFEKAEADIQGAFQMINRETVAHAAPRYLYVNREDDLGLPGLRKAKESYHPCCLRRKYLVRLSDVVFAHEGDREDIRALWQEAFGDPTDYIDEYLGFCTGENALGETWLNETILAIRRDRHVVCMGSFLEGTAVYEKAISDEAISDETISEVAASGEVIPGEPTDRAPIPVKYAYAVATSMAWRNQGLFTRLMTFAKEFYGCPILLRPGSESLRELYRSLGFVDAEGYRLTLTDELFTRSGGDIIDEPDYTVGLMIWK